MIGKKTVPKLYKMKIRTIGELAKTDERILIKKFSKYGKIMWEYANGIDLSEVQYIEQKPKSIGNSVTLPIDINQIEDLEHVVFSLTEQVTYKLRKEELFANSVSVQLRTREFNDFSHQIKLENSTCSTKVILERAIFLLREMFKKNMYIRLVGVRVDNLTDKKDTQISLFTSIEKDEKQNKLDKVVDLLNDKYGVNSVIRARNLKVDKKI